MRKSKERKFMQMNLNVYNIHTAETFQLLHSIKKQEQGILINAN